MPLGCIVFEGYCVSSAVGKALRRSIQEALMLPPFFSGFPSSFVSLFLLCTHTSHLLHSITAKPENRRATLTVSKRWTRKKRQLKAIYFSPFYIFFYFLKMKKMK